MTIIKKVNKNFLFILAVFLFMSVFTLLFTHIGTNEMYRGDDIFFHLNRIDGIALGIKNGDFFPKINYQFLSGMGYASPIFYSDLFLYPAGILRAIGLSASTSYILFLIVINFFTYLIAYQSFLYFKKVPKQAFLFAVLYGSASYRLSDLAERAALGELLALTFIPLAFVGMWTIFHGQVQKFYLLSIGMACLLFTHLLSAFIFSIFIFLYLVINIDCLLEHKERLLAFLKSIVLAVLLSLGFLLPLGEQIVSQDFYFQKNQVARIGDAAGSFLDYFKIMIRNNGFNNLGLLIVLLLILLIVRMNVLSLFSKKLLALAVAFMIFSTNLIPYHFLENTILNSIQFPWRFFLIVTFCVCWLIADNIDHLFKQALWNRIVSYTALAVTLALVLLHGLFMEEPEKYLAKENYERIPTAFLGWGSEYLPAEINIHEYLVNPQLIRSSKGVSIDNISFKYGQTTFDYQNNEGDAAQKIILPFVYYKGYQATVNGKKLEVAESIDFPGLSVIQPKEDGPVSFSYHWTVIQRVSFGISFVTWILLGFWLFKDSVKKLPFIQKVDSQTAN